MNIGLHQVAQGLVNHLMPSNLALALEGLGNNIDREVPPSALDGTCVTGMGGAVIA
jgi:hypothetical protein